MEFGDEKVAIITGASRGIGAGLVEAYRKHGYRVIANSRTIAESPHPKWCRSRVISPIPALPSASSSKR